MSQPQDLEAVRECMAAALRLTAGEALALGPETTTADLAQWDSLSHIQLVLALESRFGFRLDDEEIATLVSVRRILDAVSARRR